MTHLLVVAIAALIPLQEPAKPKPAKDWLWLFSLDDVDENSLAEWRKLSESVPLLQADFEAIMNDPKCNPEHLSGLYGLLGATKVDRKRFLKAASRDLNHDDATVRRFAAGFVGRADAGPEFAAPLMMLMLYDPKAEVSIAAREALGKVGDASTVVALEHLIRFGTGQPDTPPRNKLLAEAFVVTRDQIKARLAAAAKAAPVPPR